MHPSNVRAPLVMFIGPGLEICLHITLSLNLRTIQPSTYVYQSHI